MATAPGWYPDPRPAAGGVRWWDGADWTSWIADEPGPPPPADVPAAHASELAEAPADASTETRISTPVAVLLTVLVAVVALVAVGITVSATGQKYVRSTPSAPPSAGGRTGVIYDKAANSILVAEMSMVQPTKPWVCYGLVEDTSDLFTQYMSCSYEVHRNEKTGRIATADVIVGLLEPELAGADAPTTAEQTVARVKTALFRSATSITDLAAAPAPSRAGERAAGVTARIHYAIPGVPSRYDDVAVLAVPLTDGSYAGVVSSVPNDAPVALRTTLRQAVATVTVSG